MKCDDVGKILWNEYNFDEYIEIQWRNWLNLYKFVKSDKIWLNW